MSKYFIVSLVFNVLLVGAVITLGIGNGVRINSPDKIERHIHDHREMFQGQLMINWLMAQGNHIEWVQIEFPTRQDYLDALNALPPQESIPASKNAFWIEGHVAYSLTYPKFMVIKETK